MQLVRGLVNLGKFIMDIGRFKGLTRGLVVRGSKIEEFKGIEVRGRRRANPRDRIERLRGRRISKR